MKDLELIKQTAFKAHEGQMYGSNPYSYHLEMVYEIASEWISLAAEPKGAQNMVFAIVLCHDLMEDCRFTYNDIIELTGEKEIAENVRALTSDIRGRNRDERMSDEVYRDIQKNTWATFVKLCDRIANVKHSLETNNSMFEKYKRENVKFKQKLYSTRFHKLWQLLDYYFQYSINPMLKATK